MEFMKITDSSIKISLGAKEAAEYNITEGMVADTAEIKRSFSRLLDRAKRALGVKLPSGQLLAEVFSSRDGGYEIFVSYLKDKSENIGEACALGAACASSAVTQKCAYLVSSVDSLIYIKNKLDLCSNDYEIYSHSSAGKYYIVLKGRKKGDMSLAYLGELATPVRQGAIKYIQSYGEKIAP